LILNKFLKKVIKFENLFYHEDIGMETEIDRLEEELEKVV